MLPPTAGSAEASHGVLRFFHDRKINTKIFIGFGCVLAITAVISIIAYSALVRIAASFTEFSRLGDAVTNAQEIDQGFPGISALCN